jgi:hypothetical protein
MAGVGAAGTCRTTNDDGTNRSMMATASSPRPRSISQRGLSGSARRNRRKAAATTPLAATMSRHTA